MTRFVSETKSVSPIFNRTDLVAGVLTWLAAQVIYLWTAAPNVTLQDSGELIVAAMHFGVPHPTGYPLWTILAGLFTRMPLGNAAWEANIFSGICAAAAMGLLAVLLCSVGRWLGVRRLSAATLATALSLTCAVTVSVWTQAVIAEVYTLHILLVIVMATILYRWIRCPEWTNGYAWCFLVFALGMSNHHLMLALAPLPLLVLFLIRRDLFQEYVIYTVAAVSLLLLLYASISPHQALWKSALRFAVVMAILSSLMVLLSRRQQMQNWRHGLYLAVAIGIGFLPYAYMPVASSTNPPMNWSYTQDRDGFFSSINRSDYAGSLSDQVLGTIGKIMGISSAPATPVGPELRDGGRGKFPAFARRYFSELNRNFTPAWWMFVLICPWLLRSATRPQRVWLLTAGCGFLLAGFLEPFVSHAGADERKWSQQMPYLGYSYAMFAILCGTCLAGGIRRFTPRRDALVAILAVGSLCVPVVVFRQNQPVCSLRGHWFGWNFGHEMLKSLPTGSVVFGSSDPGRFVPTYMIFGESVQPPAVKRDPTFDRRDLYIITQFHLISPYYIRYITDHYADARPEPGSISRAWLDRDQLYPEQPLILPTFQDIEGIVQSAVDEAAAAHPSQTVALNYQQLSAAVARWIFIKNRDRHAFFVEEFIPMHWSYEYAIPHRLTLRLNPTPLSELPRDAVFDDALFWNRLVRELTENPNFREDLDAQKSYSRLRVTTGNLYRYRKLPAAAEHAYRQALTLWPGSDIAARELVTLLSNQGRFDEASDLAADVLARDPQNGRLRTIADRARAHQRISRENSALFQHLLANAENVQIVDRLLSNYWALRSPVGTAHVIREIATLNKRMSENPGDCDAIRRVLELYGWMKEVGTAAAVMQQAIDSRHSCADISLDNGVLAYAPAGRLGQRLRLIRRITELMPNHGPAWLLLAKLTIQAGNKGEAARAVGQILSLNDAGARQSGMAHAALHPLFLADQAKAELQAEDTVLQKSAGKYE